MPICPICSSVATPDYRAAEFWMFRCQSCFTAFVDPMPEQEFLTSFYDRYHRELDQGGEYGSFEHRVAEDFEAKLDIVRKVLGPGQHRTLDVGCGRGYFVDASRRAGLSAEGIDLSASAIEHAREKLGLLVHLGRLEDHTESFEPFDAISFWATVEHLPNPVRTLRAIRQVLKPHGYLFLDTGIGWDWLDRLLPGRTQWYDPPQHLFVFSKQGMQKALDLAGFDLVRLDPCFERSRSRRVAKILRGAVTAAGLRMVSSLGRLGQVPPVYTRFPIGNLMVAIGRARE